MDLTEALKVMDTPVRIPGQSDAALVAAVQTHLSAITAKAGTSGIPVKSLSPASGVETGISARPIEALQRIARATRPPISADIYHWYQHWSWLRYLGIFEIAHGHLKLSGAGMGVRANQRRVLSEEIGVGFGVLVAERWCRHLGARGSIQVIDVDLALNNRRRWSSRGGRLWADRRQPDYLMVYPNPTGSRAFSFTFKTVECKGTTRQTSVPGQLARASTQLASLHLGAAAPQGIAVGTISDATGVRYRAIDPEDEESPDMVSLTDQDLQSARHPRERPRPQRGILALPASEFIARSVLIGMGELADYACNVSAAAELLPPVMVEGYGGRMPERLVKETEDGQFVGVEHLLPTPEGRNLRVFSGVVETVDTALASGHLDAVRAAQDEFHEQRLGRAAARSATRREPGRAESDSVSAVSDDGAVLILAH